MWKNPFHVQRGWPSVSAPLAPFHVKRPAVPWCLLRNQASRSVVMTPVTSESETVPESVPHLQLPRIGPKHVVLWLITATTLWTLRAGANVAFGRIVQQVGPWTTFVLDGFSAAVLAAALVGAAILIHYLRSGPGRLEPGHWILIYVAVSGFLFMLISPIWRSHDSADQIMIVVAIWSLISGAFYWYAAIRLEDAKKWKTAFAWYAAALLLTGGMDLLMSSRDFPLCITGLLFVVMLPTWLSLMMSAISFISAIVTDVRSRLRRDWLHWAGIIAIITPVFVGVAMQFARWLALP